VAEWCRGEGRPGARRPGVTGLAPRLYARFDELIGQGMSQWQAAKELEKEQSEQLGEVVYPWDALRARIKRNKMGQNVPPRAPINPETCTVSDLQPLIDAGKKFRTIYADPPGPIPTKPPDPLMTTNVVRVESLGPGPRGGAARSTQVGVTMPAPRWKCWRTTGAGGGRQPGPRRGTHQTPYLNVPFISVYLWAAPFPLKRPSEEPQVVQ
jgi:hypothetical protein